MQNNQVQSTVLCFGRLKLEEVFSPILMEVDTMNSDRYILLSYNSQIITSKRSVLPGMMRIIGQTDSAAGTISSN